MAIQVSWNFSRIDVCLKFRKAQQPLTTTQRRILLENSNGKKSLFTDLSSTYEKIQLNSCLSLCYLFTLFPGLFL